ncbi:MAG: flagellar hook-associated protein FlgK [Burkholderiales bacterium]|nr:flagellar hook-associated protein FlgK [Burkholderiales bacterium]
MSMISIGMSGLNAAQTGLHTTSHNITNVHTPGFSRQSTLQTTGIPQFSGAGYLGQGVDVVSVTRSYSSFLDLQAREAQTMASHLNALAAQLASVDQMFSDPSAGLAPALDEFFGAIGAVAASPADTASRAVLVSSGEMLAARVRDLYQRLESLRDGVNAQVGASAASLNGLAAGVAELNRQIVRAAAAGDAPIDLLDRRDTMLRDMAKEIRITAVATPTGAVNVALSNGQPLVLEGDAFEVAAGRDEYDVANVVLGIQAGSRFQAFAESTITGGKLGGVAEFRSVTLDTAQNALGRLAGMLADAINAQHAVGQDRTGALGGAMFAFAGPTVQSGDNNVGSASLTATIADYGAVTTSDYVVGYDGTNYVMRRLSDGQMRTFASLPQTVDGVTLTLASGTPAAGDSFKLLPSRYVGAGFDALITDPAKIAAALPMRAAAGGANSGAGVLRVESVAPPANANLTQPVTITFTSATTFNVTGTGTGNPVGLTYTPGMALTYNGWTASLRGTVAAGDTFSVSPNVNGIGDNGNLRALSAVATRRVLDGGTASAGEAYAQAVSLIGNQTYAATVRMKAQDAVLTQADAARDTVAGVNLDEEAANLLKYQQSYQAASRIIATANAMFDEILGIAR